MQKQLVCLPWSALTASSTALWLHSSRLRVQFEDCTCESTRRHVLFPGSAQSQAHWNTGLSRKWDPTTKNEYNNIFPAECTWMLTKTCIKEQYGFHFSSGRPSQVPRIDRHIFPSLYRFGLNLTFPDPVVKKAHFGGENGYPVGKKMSNSKSPLAYGVSSGPEIKTLMISTRPSS